MKTIRKCAIAAACLLAAVLLLDPAMAGEVNVNTADAETLADELNGIGPVKAKAIIEYREQNGPFKWGLYTQVPQFPTAGLSPLLWRPMFAPTPYRSLNWCRSSTSSLRPMGSPRFLFRRATCIRANLCPMRESGLSDRRAGPHQSTTPLGAAPGTLQPGKDTGGTDQGESAKDSRHYPAIPIGRTVSPLNSCGKTHNPDPT